MKRIITALISTLCLTCCPRVAPEKNTHIVLPNPKLLGCRASACSQLWPDDTSPNAIYPRQVVVETFGDTPCPLGLQAIYEKSVPLENLKAAIDERYGKWALPSNITSPVKLWRVEPEKFAIQLAVTEDRTKLATPEERSAYAIGQAIDQRKRSNVAEGGMGQVIYIGFINKTCGSR